MDKNIVYVGVDDTTLDLFEGQYVIPEGVSYNSYIVFGSEGCAVMDTVDGRCTAQWLGKVAAALAERGVKAPDYLVVQHLEPDHSGSLDAFMQAYPQTVIVCSKKAAAMFPQFYEKDYSAAIRAVSEGESLNLGDRELVFYAAPMVHWPEVIVSFEKATGTLFSADGLGKFGALGDDITAKTEGWACEARRYYFNIVGKYGAQVQALLKKASTLPSKAILPLHGPVIEDNLGFYLGLYDTWSAYRNESEGVFIAYASMHGNTGRAAKLLAAQLEAKGVKVALNDLNRDDFAEGVEDAFRYDRMVLASPTYDGGLFPKMEEFLGHLAAKTYRNRRVAVIENGSWAPSAAKHILARLEQMNGISIVGSPVTIRTRVTEENIEALKALAEELAIS